MARVERVSVEFATTGFCPAFQGAAIALESEEFGYDIQLFGENHNMSADLFGEMRAAAEAARIAKEEQEKEAAERKKKKEEEAAARKKRKEEEAAAAKESRAAFSFQC